MRADAGFKINSKIDWAVRSAIKSAVAYQKATGRKLGITAEVGEYWAAKKMKLLLAESGIQEGFDAIKNGKKYQIKSRRSDHAKEPKMTGRLGTFSKHTYDYALVVLLDDVYQPIAIYQLDFKTTEALCRNNKRRNPTIRSFTKKARRIFPKG